MDTNEMLNVTNEPISNVKKKRPIFLIIMLIIIIFVLSVWGIIYYNKQNVIKGNAFIDLLTKNQYILEMFKEYGKNFSDGEYNYSLSYINDSGEKNYMMAKVVKQNETLDGKLYENDGEKEEAFLDFIKGKDTFAIYKSDVYEKYIAISSENIGELGEKFGYNFSILEDKENRDKAINFLKKLSNRYIEFIGIGIGKNVKIEKNKEVLIANNPCNVDIYRVNVDLNVVLDIYKQIIRVLRYDREGTALVAAIVANNQNKSIDDVYDEVMQNIENQYNALLFVGNIDKSENEDLFEIVLYVENEKNIKTQILFKDEYNSEISLECRKNGEIDCISYLQIFEDEKIDIICNLKNLDGKILGDIKINKNGENIYTLNLDYLKDQIPAHGIRKIKNQNYILLNRASDDELNDVCENLFNMSLDEFKESNLKDEVITEVPEKNFEEKEKELYQQSEAFVISNMLEIGMTREKVLELMRERGAEVKERIDGSIAITKSGKTIVSVYFDENDNITIIYDEIHGSTKF